MHVSQEIEFSTGTPIPVSGIYSVNHSAHRLPHTVVLSVGDLFPRCAGCADKVSFTLIQEVKQLFENGAVRLYELPVIEDDAAEAEAAG